MTMIKKYKLFFTPMCPNCPAVKDYMKNVKLEGDLVDANSEQGREDAAKYGIMSVPVVVFLDEEGKEISRAINISEIKRAIENKTLADI